jgi:hypothetical protein
MKILKPKKTKGTRQYINILWRHFSWFIRQRDGGVCFTCGKKCSGVGYHAGHFIPVGGNGGHALRFDERNVNGQCFNCNINLGGNGGEYYRRMVVRYGQSVVDELYEMKTHPVKWSDTMFAEKIKYYSIKNRYSPKNYGS